MYSQISLLSSYLCLVVALALIFEIVVGAGVPGNSFEWHTQNYNSIHANKLVQSIAATEHDTITLGPLSCVRNKNSCNEKQCCFGQIACCKSTGVCGCRGPNDSSHSCPYDIATTSISSNATSSDKSVSTNACIQTISGNPKAAVGAYNGVGGGGRGRGARNLQNEGARQPRNTELTQQPIISYKVTPQGDLKGFVRTAASGDAYLLTTTTSANFGPVKRFMAEFSAWELMEYLEDEVVEELLELNRCKRWQIFRK